MSDNTGPFRQARAEYLKRLTAAAVCIAAAAAGARLVTATTHWVVALAVLCIGGALGAMLGWEVIQRFYQLRRQALVTDAPKLHGLAGPELPASAVE